MTGDARTNKQIILQMVQKWPEDISFDQALYHVGFLKAVDDGMKDFDAGRTRDHDEVFDELEALCDEEEHARLVEILRHFAKRPALYVGNDDPERVELWLSGFRAVIHPKTEKHRVLCERVLESRGWEVTSTSSWRQMIEKNLTPFEIITELIEIEIEILNKMYGANTRQK